MLASTPGRVRRTGYESPGYGRFVEIGHDRGLTSLYAHLSRVDLHPGDRVVIDETERGSESKPSLRMRAF